MAFKPKLAWEHIRLISEDKKYHHSTPKVIQMKLPCGQLAKNDDKSVIMFARHLKKVLDNHKPTNDTIINDIKLR